MKKLLFAIVLIEGMAFLPSVYGMFQIEKENEAEKREAALLESVRAQISQIRAGRSNNIEILEAELCSYKFNEALAILYDRIDRYTSAVVRHDFTGIKLPYDEPGDNSFIEIGTEQLLHSSSARPTKAMESVESLLTTWHYIYTGGYERHLIDAIALLRGVVSKREQGDILTEEQMDSLLCAAGTLGVVHSKLESELGRVSKMAWSKMRKESAETK